MEQVDNAEALPLNHYVRDTSDDAEVWSIDHYARDVSEHILNYAFNTGNFPNVQFAEGPVGPETQPQLVDNTMVVTVPPEIDREQFAVTLSTNYQNGVNLEIDYGNSNSQCKISIFKPNVTSHDGALNEVKILNQQNKYQPTYYRLVQKDNNYLIMACTAASLEEKKMIQNQYEAGNNYNRSFENRTLSDSEPQDAKKTYLRALQHFAITGEMPNYAAEQAPDENDTDERALHTACAILEQYNNNGRQTLLKNSLVALLSKSNLPQEETLTEFAKCLVHVVSKIDDTPSNMESTAQQLRGETNGVFKLELLYNVYDKYGNYCYNYNEEFESEDIYDLDSDIDKLFEGKIYIPGLNTPFQQPLANHLSKNGIHYDRGSGLVKITQNACSVEGKVKGNRKFDFEGHTRLIEDKGNVLVFNLNGTNIRVPQGTFQHNGENYKVYCRLDTDEDFQGNKFSILVSKNKQKVINNVLHIEEIEEIVENALPVQNNSYQSAAPVVNSVGGPLAASVVNPVGQLPVISSVTNGGLQPDNINNVSLGSALTLDNLSSIPTENVPVADMANPFTLATTTNYSNNFGGHSIMNENYDINSTNNQEYNDTETPTVGSGFPVTNSQNAETNSNPNAIIISNTQQPQYNNNNDNVYTNLNTIVTHFTENINGSNIDISNNGTIGSANTGDSNNINVGGVTTINTNLFDKRKAMYGKNNDKDIEEIVNKFEKCGKIHVDDIPANEHLAQIAEEGSILISSNENNISNNGNQILASGRNQNNVYNYYHKNLNNGTILNVTNNQIKGAVTSI